MEITNLVQSLIIASPNKLCHKLYGRGYGHVTFNFSVRPKISTARN